MVIINFGAEPVTCHLSLVTSNIIDMRHEEVHSKCPLFFDAKQIVTLSAIVEYNVRYNATYLGIVPYLSAY